MKSRKATNHATLCKVGALIAITLALTGCDQNREAREAAQREAARHEIIATELRSKQERLQSEIAANDRGVAEQNKLIAELEQKRAAQRAELMNYLSDNKAAAMALAAAGSGAAVAMDDDIRHSLNSSAGEGASGFAFLAGLVGGVYCLSNAEDCARVAARIAAYGAANKDTDGNIRRARDQIESLQAGSAALRKQRTDLEPRLNDANTNANNARSRVEQLKCKGLLC